MEKLFNRDSLSRQSLKISQIFDAKKENSHSTAYFVAQFMLSKTYEEYFVVE